MVKIILIGLLILMLIPLIKGDEVLNNCNLMEQNICEVTINRDRTSSLVVVDTNSTTLRNGGVDLIVTDWRNKEQRIRTERDNFLIDMGGQPIRYRIVRFDGSIIQVAFAWENDVLRERYGR